MTIAERNNKLKHFIACLKCETSGKPCDVNCSTQYDAGNMGEIIENLEAISKALEQEPTTKDLEVDCIDKTELLKAMDICDKFGFDPYEGRILLSTPVLQDRYVPYVKYDDIVNCVKDMLSVAAHLKVIQNAKESQYMNNTESEKEEKRLDISHSWKTSKTLLENVAEWDKTIEQNRYVN